MGNRRLAVIAALSIVELWILGLMIRSVSGGGHESNFASAATRGPSSGGFERTLATGPAPHVTIDDDDAVLTVTVRAGSTVTVREEVHAGGWGAHGAQQLSTVEKTADGVTITGPDGIIVAGMMSLERRLDVVVPPGATLEVKNAGATTVTGLQGEATLHSDDGTITVSGARGSLTASTDNGRIEISDVIAAAVDLSSDDGRISLDRVVADDVSVTTDNGRIDVARSLLRGGKLKTDDGRIMLGLDPRSDVTVDAQASAGRVVVQAPLTATRASGDDDAPSSIRVGSGAGRLDVASDDGVITVLTGRVE